MGDVYRQTADIPSDLIKDDVFHCPVSGCKNEMQVSNLNGFSCPECGNGFVIKLVSDVLIPTVRRRGVTGYMKVVDMPELPRERRKRFTRDHDIHDEQAGKLTTSMEVADFYEDLANVVSAKTAASFIADTLVGELHYRDQSIQTVGSDEVVDLATAIDNGKITRKSAVQVVREALDDDRSVDNVFSEKDLEKTDKETLDEIVRGIVRSESEAVQDYRNGERDAINYLVGQVMSETDGQADAEDTRESIVSEIDNM